MRGSRSTQIGIAVIGLLLVAWLVLSFAFRGEDTPKRAAVQDDKHCPICGRELPRHLVGGECPYCKLDGGANAAKGRRSDSVLVSPVIPIVLIATLGTLLGIHFLFLARTRLVGHRAEVFCQMHCPRCGRKLRYRRSQIGRLGQCPACARPLLFPRPANEANGPWAKIRQKILQR